MKGTPREGAPGCTSVITVTFFKKPDPDSSFECGLFSPFHEVNPIAFQDAFVVSPEFKLDQWCITFTRSSETSLVAVGKTVLGSCVPRRFYDASAYPPAV